MNQLRKPKHKIRPYVDHNDGWSDHEWAQELKRALDTEEIRRHSGRSMFRLLNTYLIRNVMRRAEFDTK